MAIGVEVRHLSVRTEDFQISFWEPFLMIGVCAVVGVEAILSVNQVPCGFFLAGIVFPVLTLLLSSFAVLVLQRLFPIVIGPERIECYDFWGHPLTAHWDEMSGVKVVKFLGVDYLRILLTNGRHAIWLPLFVERFDDMTQLICLHAGGDHPVARALQQQFEFAEQS